ncbi:MAG: ankyrin repeat domain-containing protein [Rickettsiales bacterium]|nr:ankyrin repeat domain-containing protein [Rickettsiales bacterium]
MSKKSPEETIVENPAEAQIKEFAALKRSKVDLNAVNSATGETIVMQAVREGKLTLLDILITNDADLKIKNAQNQNALEIAAATENSEAINKIITCHLKKNGTYDVKSLLDLLTTIYGNETIKDSLNDESLRELNKIRRNPNLEIGDSPEFPMIKRLLAELIYENYTSYRKEDFKFSQQDLLDSLKLGGVVYADIGESITIISEKDKDVQVVKKVDQNLARYKKGPSFSLDSSIEDFKKLLTQGAKANLPDKDGITPLMIAAQNSSIKFFSALKELNIKADLNAKDSEGKTALIHAVSASTDYDYSGRDHRAPIMAISLPTNYYKITEYLLKNGANPNEKYGENTALEIAVRENHHPRIISALINAGAEISEKAVEIAERNRNFTIQTLLEDYLQPASEQPSEFEIAVRDNDLENILRLIKDGAEISERAMRISRMDDNKEITPLLEYLQNLTKPAQERYIQELAQRVLNFVTIKFHPTNPDHDITDGTRALDVTRIFSGGWSDEDQSKLKREAATKFSPSELLVLSAPNLPGHKICQEHLAKLIEGGKSDVNSLQSSALARVYLNLFSDDLEAQPDIKASSAQSLKAKCLNSDRTLG